MIPPSRSSFCPAARALGEPDWEAEAIATALAAAARPIDPEQDASLCHGTAGLAHIYNRLFQATGDRTLAAAARRYLDRTLELGTGGEYRFRLDQDLVAARAGLRIGSAGVALALLAAASDVEPAWDRLFLLSFKRRGRPGSPRRRPPPRS